MSVRTYETTWGVRVWLVSILVTLMLAAVPCMILFAEPSPDRWFGFILVATLDSLILGVTSLFVVRRFEMENGVLRVQRGFWKNEINLSDLESVEIDPDAMRGAWKTIGNDGLFAIHGRFRSKRLGKFRAFVTDPANSVLLRFSRDLVVVSPDEPRSFARDITRQLEQVRSKPHAC